MKSVPGTSPAFPGILQPWYGMIHRNMIHSILTYPLLPHPLSHPLTRPRSHPFPLPLTCPLSPFYTPTNAHFHIPFHTRTLTSSHSVLHTHPSTHPYGWISMTVGSPLSNHPLPQAITGRLKVALEDC